MSLARAAPVMQLQEHSEVDSKVGVEGGSTTLKPNIAATTNVQHNCTINTCGEQSKGSSQFHSEQQTKECVVTMCLGDLDDASWQWELLRQLDT